MRKFSFLGAKFLARKCKNFGSFLTETPLLEVSPRGKTRPRKIRLRSKSRFHAGYLFWRIFVGQLQHKGRTAKHQPNFPHPSSADLWTVPISLLRDHGLEPSCAFADLPYKIGRCNRRRNSYGLEPSHAPVSRRGRKPKA